MCWITVKVKEKDIPYEYMDNAYKHNQDGFGVAWVENKEVKVFKTLDYQEFKDKLETLKDFGLVIHLRNTTVGDTTEENCHPFRVRNGGVMFHNGTIFTLKSKAKNGMSDSMVLRDIINECRYPHISNIAPLVKTIVGDTINRVVFVERTGKVTIINPELGIWEDGIWYSNDYHLKKNTWTRNNTTTTSVCCNDYTLDDDDDWYDTYFKNRYSHTPVEDESVPEFYVNDDNKVVTKVFVYGTLKAGYSNHNTWMKGAKFRGEGKTTDKWAMIGTDYAFPYMLEEDKTFGHHCKGEVYEVTKEGLDRLDRLEGYPTHYKRKTVDITLDNGVVEQAVMYYKANVTYRDYGEEYIDEFVKRKVS